MSRKPVRILSDEEVAAILDRRDQDQRDPADLVSDDELFLKRCLMRCRGDPSKMDDTFLAAAIVLLISDIPLSRGTREMLAYWIARLWSDPKDQGRFAHSLKDGMMQQDFEVTVADKKRKGVPHPAKAARAELASRWGHHSDEAVRKALQRNRLGRHRLRRR
jgi:hypothetical protein